MARIIARAAWGARPPRDDYTPLPTARGVKIHYTGGRVDPRILDDHDVCLDLMARIQRHHMDGNGWSDFAYNLAACCHGRMLMGRGARVMSAANGAGNNRGHYAVLALLGNAGYATPTPELLHALRDCVEYLRKNGAGPEIKGHRDGYDTDCPGAPLYAWVRAGAPRPADTEERPDQTDPAAAAAPPFGGRLLTYPPITRGDDVRRWQARARELGHQLAVDGAYGPASQRVCRRIQCEAGLLDDGIVGPLTWAATFAPRPSD